MDFYGEIIVWDRSHKNHFYGTGPVILGPVPLNWDRSPANVFILKIGLKKATLPFYFDTVFTSILKRDLHLSYRCLKLKFLCDKCKIMFFQSCT